jgi:hypothetical protein
MAEHRTSMMQANAVVETKNHWLLAQLSNLKLVGWRIALTVVFFFLKETIRFLD